MSYLFVYQTTLIIADQKQYIINKYDIITIDLSKILKKEIIALCNIKNPNPDNNIFLYTK